MIDPLNEELLSLPVAAKTLPTRRGGKRPHASCLYSMDIVRLPRRGPGVTPSGLDPLHVP